MREIGGAERLYLFLNYGTEHAVRTFDALLARYPEPEEAFAAARNRDSAAFSGVSERVCARLLEAAAPGFLERYMETLDQSGIGVCTRISEDYPKLLRETADPPSVLFYKGRMVSEPKLPIAVIGARACTPYGAEIAETFSYDLAKNGATVVSGLATGVDGRAAKGALTCREAGYPTVAVLGSGIDVIYPADHISLAAEIAARGCVLTEFLPGRKPAREHFPIRNRVISGLSMGVVVVEAGERSGTTITAGYALEQGRDVFAVPGRVTDRMSVGANRMIQRGEAKPVFCVADILSEYGAEACAEEKLVIRVSALSGIEQRVCRALENAEKSADELASELALPPGELNSCLTALMFSGIMKQLPGRVYALDLMHTTIEFD